MANEIYVKGIVKDEDGKVIKNKDVTIKIGEGENIQEYDIKTNNKGEYEKVISLTFFY